MRKGAVISKDCRKNAEKFGALDMLHKAESAFRKCLMTAGEKHLAQMLRYCNTRGIIRKNNREGLEPCLIRQCAQS